MCSLTAIPGLGIFVINLLAQGYRLMATRIALIRHGHIAGIQPERFRGRAEVPLSELGVQQAALTAARCQQSIQPVAVLTSPLGRALDTGRAIATAFDLEPEVLPGLYDIDYGDWQWKTHEEVAAAYPAAYARWKNLPDQMQMPGGESLQQVLVRVTEGLMDVLNRFEDKTVVMVGHDSVNRVLLLHMLGLPLSRYWSLKQDPCCINEIEFENGKFTIHRINETWHLES